MTERNATHEKRTRMGQGQDIGQRLCASLLSKIIIAVKPVAINLTLTAIVSQYICVASLVFNCTDRTVKASHLYFRDNHFPYAAWTRE